MREKALPPVHWPFLLSLAGAKLLFHLLTNVNYGFHRDEFLYLALGQHAGWGHWSNPPFIGWMSWLVQTFLGDSMFALRLIPSILGATLVILAGLMAREMGGGRVAQLLAGMSILVSPTFLRGGWLFQPVIFDVFFWTLFAWLILRFLNTEEKRYLYYLGIAIGLGFLNKYSVGFFLLGLLPALLLTPQRRLLASPGLWKAAGLTVLIILPNLIWQYAHNFPVVSHMEGLARNQLVNVSRVNFVLDQLLFNLPAAPVWIAGLVFLFREKGKPYRLLGWHFLAVVLLFILLRGKSYYTMGLYPFLMAAGGVFWEGLFGRLWPALLLSTVMAGITLPFLPLGVPVLNIEKMVEYCEWLHRDVGMDAPMRWEDGELHPLPQDYADMLGWLELANQVIQTYESVDDQDGCAIYCENYGQAGAIEHFGKKAGLPPVVSFSDTYRLWAPRKADIHTLIYVNNELGPDIDSLFAEIRVFDGITHPYARENGLKVYLCRKPRESFNDFYVARTRPVFERFER